MAGLLGLSEDWSAALMDVVGAATGGSTDHYNQYAAGQRQQQKDALAQQELAWKQEDRGYAADERQYQQQQRDRKESGYQAGMSNLDDVMSIYGVDDQTARAILINPEIKSMYDAKMRRDASASAARSAAKTAKLAKVTPATNTLAGQINNRLLADEGMMDMFDEEEAALISADAAVRAKEYMTEGVDENTAVSKAVQDVVQKGAKERSWTFGLGDSHTYERPPMSGSGVIAPAVDPLREAKLAEVRRRGLIK